MGYSLSWTAVKGRSNKELKQVLGFRSTGTHGNYGEHTLVGRQLRDGWYLLIANTCDDRIAQNITLAHLSKGCQAVACSIEEHVMFSSCVFWNEGKKVWSVKHREDPGRIRCREIWKSHRKLLLTKNRIDRNAEIRRW